MEKYVFYYSGSRISVLGEDFSPAPPVSMLWLRSTSTNDVAKVFDFLEKGIPIPEIIIQTADKQTIWNEILSQCIPIEACGGLVHHIHTNQYALIHRRGLWDLPKGKRDLPEKRRQTAVREVTEETGIQNLTIENKLAVTHHIYWLNNQRIMKQTHWYLMRTSWSGNLTGDPAEGIDHVAWIPELSVPKLLHQGHKLNLDVWNAYLNLHLNTNQSPEE